MFKNQHLQHRGPNRLTIQVSITLLIFSICLVCNVILVNAQTASTISESSHAESLLIYFEPNTDLETRDEVLRSLNATLISWTEAIGMAEIQISKTGCVRASMATSGFAHASITGVEQDAAVVQGAYLPNDPALQERQKSYAQQLLQMEDAWDYTLGHEGAVIAILDTGLNPQHIEFGRSPVAGYNFVADSTNYRDDHGHGTHIAGIINAQINNNIGTVGLCPQCSLIIVKVLNHKNYGTWSTIARGIVYAVDNGADIINLSLGSKQTSQAIERAVEYAKEHDVLIVAAAGNERIGKSYYPSALDDVIGVSATDDRDEYWVLSNYGTNIDLSAPGYMIYSTGDENNVQQNDAFSYMTGTSMAVPHVVGLAGLLLSQDANRTSAQLTDILIKSSEDLGEEGWDPKYGHGRVNAAKALASAGVVPTRQAEEATEIALPSAEHQLRLPLVLQ